MSYQVMEYLDAGCACPIGYAFLEAPDFEVCKRTPKESQVKAYVVVGGMEEMAEWGLVDSARLWDYRRAVGSLPPTGVNVAEWLSPGALS